MYKPTQEGLEYLERGFPERQLLSILLSGEKTMEQLSAFPKITIAMGWAKKNGWIRIAQGKISVTEDGRKFVSQKNILEEALEKVGKSGDADKDSIQTLLSRNLIEEAKEAPAQKEKVGFLGRILTKKKPQFEIHEPGQRPVEVLTEVKETGEIAQLTPDLIKFSKWKQYPFKRYDVTTPAPKLMIGKKQPYVQFIEDVQDLLIGLGFKEMRGPLVETSFWNCDALFMPQDHPGRSVHDVLLVKNPPKGELPDKNLVARVKATHEGGWITESTGWGGTWSEEEASKLLMRSQTTSVSARTLFEHGDRPGKYFSIGRNYRYDVIDAKHLIEFYQCEGIVIGEKMTFKNLLGYLKEFAAALGINEIKFKPGYFPFTEPSVEGYVKHPKMGWIEVLPAGLMRPEVLKPLGIEKCNVLAWGIGLDRLAMIKLGVDDIRELFSDDLDFLRNAPMVR